LTNSEVQSTSVTERLQDLSMNLYINYTISSLYAAKAVEIALNTFPDLLIYDQLGSTSHEYQTEPYSSVARKHRPKLEGDDFKLRGLHIVRFKRATMVPRAVYGIILNEEDERYEGVLLGRGIINAIATQKFGMEPIFPDEPIQRLKSDRE
jgi:hypothetical protein